MTITVKIVPNDKGTPPGKLCDAELIFSHVHAHTLSFFAVAAKTLAPHNPDIAARLTAIGTEFQSSPLAGLKLCGFALWQSRAGGRSVTFPARSFQVNGQRRSFALLRPVLDLGGQEAIRDLILEAYAQHEREAAGDDDGDTDTTAFMAVPR